MGAPPKDGKALFGSAGLPVQPAQAEASDTVAGKASLLRAAPNAMQGTFACEIALYSAAMVIP
jgi:hypothetical protein